MSKQVEVLNELKSKLSNLLAERLSSEYGVSEGWLDVKVLIDGEEFVIELNADVHEGLESFVDGQIEIEKKLKECVNKG